MSEEGYLQLKIREINENLTKLEDDLKEIRVGYEKKIENRQSFIDELNKLLRDFRFGEIKMDIHNEVDSCFNSTFQEKYARLHKLIEKEVECLANSIKPVIRQFSDEVALERRDISVLMSLLLSKGIITQQEINQLEKQFDKFIKGDFGNHIFNQFSISTKKGEPVDAQKGEEQK